jgi:hypothetical protein
MPRPHDWFNAKTGDEATGVLVIKGAKYPRGLQFLTMFADGWRELAQLRPNGTEWRVLAAARISERTTLRTGGSA